MRTLGKSTLAALVAASITLLGCPSDDSEGTADDDDTTSADDDSNTMTDPTNTMTDPTNTMTDPTETETSPDTSASGPDTTATDGDSSTTENLDEFEFNDTPPEEYVQVDRKGFPAVNTGLNLLGDKDEYNIGDPVADAAGMFVPNILDSLDTLHRGAPGMQTVNNTGLDDDLGALGLTPCIPPQLANDDCDEQGVPFVIPDTLDIDLDNPAGFPNGRQLENQAIDIIFAVLLLNLVDEAGAPVQPTHPVDTFASIPLNPGANDVEFPAEFPFLAPPN